jgi:type IV secretory pathway VirB10-like protein
MNETYRRPVPVAAPRPYVARGGYTPPTPPSPPAPPPAAPAAPSRREREEEEREAREERRRRKREREAAKAAEVRSSVMAGLGGRGRGSGRVGAWRTHVGLGVTPEEGVISVVE